MSKIKPINLESDTFALMKQDMTNELNRLLRNMQRYKAEEGMLTVKVKVSIVDQELDNGEQGDVPTFEHKVSTSVQIKQESSGKLSGNYVLEEDGKGGFVIRPLSEQLDMLEEPV